MAKSKRTSSRRSQPYDKSGDTNSAQAEVKSEPPPSETPSIKPEDETPVIEIPEVTPPPEPTHNEKRIAYLMQHAILSTTLPGYGTFQLVKVPETTGKFQLGLIRSNGTVVEPPNILTSSRSFKGLVSITKAILKVIYTDDKSSFLTTNDHWKTWLLTSTSSPNHKYLYLARYVKQDLNGTDVEPLLKDDFTLKSKDGEEISLNLRYIKAKSPEFRQYLDKNSTDNSLNLDYSSASIKALVGYFYRMGIGGLKYHTAVELLKMNRDLQLKDASFRGIVEEQVLKYPMELPEALEVWKLTHKESAEARRRCISQFKKSVTSLKSSDEFYELFKSQQFTIDDIIVFLKWLSENRWY